MTCQDLFSGRKKKKKKELWSAAVVIGTSRVIGYCHNQAFLNCLSQNAGSVMAVTKARRLVGKPSEDLYYISKTLMTQTSITHLP